MIIIDKRTKSDEYIKKYIQKQGKYDISVDKLSERIPLYGVTIVAK